MDTESQIDGYSLAAEIKETESKVKDVEFELGRLREQLELLRQQYADSIVIEWREEIENCLKGAGDRPIFTSYEVILNNIETKYGIIASPKVKNTVITTLSAMFQESTIGRTEYNGIHYYGLKELFLDDDLSTVKREFLSLFDKCRVYVENFESEA